MISVMESDTMGKPMQIADLIPLPTWAMLQVAREAIPCAGDVVLFYDRAKKQHLGRFDRQCGAEVQVTVFTPDKPTGETMMVNAAALCGVLDSVKMLRARTGEVQH